MINLVNAEVLDYNQAANYINGGMYQFGRKVTLGITAFMLPLSGTETSKFSTIDVEEQAFINAIEESGFVSSITINGQIIENVKILSYEFPTNMETIENHIQVLRVNMSLEFTEEINNKSTLTNASPAIYTDTTFLDNAKYFESFSEKFNFSVTEKYEYNFTHNIEFSLRKNSKATVNFVSIAKQIALDVFNGAAPEIGYIDDRYKDFIRVVQGNGIFQESYDSISNSYTFARSMAGKNGLYKSDQKGENWSAEATHQVAVNENGDVVITENGTVQGKTNIPLTLDDVEDKKGDDAYENAFIGFLVMKNGAYTRCQGIFSDFITNTPDWVPSTMEWGNTAGLKTKPVSFGKTLNRTGGAVNYVMTFTNNPRMHNDAMFEYTLQSQRSESNVTITTENGTITPYNTSKARTLWDQKDLKGLYDSFTKSSDVIDRLNPLFNSVKKSSIDLSYPRDLTSSSLSFNVYGKSITYSFEYSDDPTLLDETYIRKLSTNETENMPVAIRSSVIAPNVKQTNYDSNQTTEGSKALSMNAIFKRNPNSNLINKAHTDYLKAASDSIVTTLKGKVQSRAFINSPQVGKNELSWYLTSFTHGFTSEYNFTFDADMNFIDKKGVAPEASEY